MKLIALILLLASCGNEFEFPFQSVCQSNFKGYSTLEECERAGRGRVRGITIPHAAYYLQGVSVRVHDIRGKYARISTAVLPGTTWTFYLHVLSWQQAKRYRYGH